MAMKTIKSNSYIKNVEAQLKMNPSKAESIEDPVQNDPKIRTFANNYSNLTLSAFTVISQSDASLLDNIQKDIRFQLRRLGAQSLSN